MESIQRILFFREQTATLHKKATAIIVMIVNLHLLLYIEKKKQKKNP